MRLFKQLEARLAACPPGQYTAAELVQILDLSINPRHLSALIGPKVSTNPARFEAPLYIDRLVPGTQTWSRGALITALQNLPPQVYTEAKNLQHTLYDTFDTLPPTCRFIARVLGPAPYISPAYYSPGQEPDPDLQVFLKARTPEPLTWTPVTSIGPWTNTQVGRHLLNPHRLVQGRRQYLEPWLSDAGACHHQAYRRAIELGFEPWPEDQGRLLYLCGPTQELGMRPALASVHPTAQVLHPEALHNLALDDDFVVLYPEAKHNLTEKFLTAKFGA